VCAAVGECVRCVGVRVWGVVCVCVCVVSVSVCGGVSGMRLSLCVCVFGYRRVLRFCVGCVFVWWCLCVFFVCLCGLWVFVLCG